MKVFLIVFALSVLFIIASASALKYFDNRGLQNRLDKKKSDQSREQAHEPPCEDDD